MGFEPRTAKVLKSQHFSAFDHTNTYKEMAFLALFTLVPAEEVTIRADFFASSSQTYYTHFKPKTASKKLKPEEEIAPQTDRQTDGQTDRRTKCGQ